VALPYRTHLKGPLKGPTWPRQPSKVADAQLFSLGTIPCHGKGRAMLHRQLCRSDAGNQEAGHGKDLSDAGGEGEETWCDESCNNGRVKNPDQPGRKELVRSRRSYRFGLRR